MTRADELVHTSVDDCRSSLQHEGDIKVLEIALTTAKEFEYKTKAKLIEARIRSLEKQELAEKG